MQETFVSVPKPFLKHELTPFTVYDTSVAPKTEYAKTSQFEKKAKILQDHVSRSMLVLRVPQ